MNRDRYASAYRRVAQTHTGARWRREKRPRRTNTPLEPCRRSVSRDPRSMTTTTASRTTTAVGGGQSAWNEVGPRVRLG